MDSIDALCSISSCRWHDDVNYKTLLYRGNHDKLSMYVHVIACCLLSPTLLDWGVHLAEYNYKYRRVHVGRFNIVVAPIASPNVCIQCELKYSSYGNIMLLTRMYHLAVFYCSIQEFKKQFIRSIFYIQYYSASFIGCVYAFPCKQIKSTRSYTPM